MPLYGTAQAGGYPTVIYPGDNFTMFDGTETPATTTISIAFLRGNAPAGIGDNGTSFDASGMPSGMVIDIQVANADVTGNYNTVGQIAPDANGNGNYPDIGRSAYYRAKISAYTTGAMPILIARR